MDIERVDIVLRLSHNLARLNVSNRWLIRDGNPQIFWVRFGFV